VISLGDILSMIKPATQEAPVPIAGVPQDRQAYLAYSEMVMTKGGQPLPYPEWVKAGRPQQ